MNDIQIYTCSLKHTTEMNRAKISKQTFSNQVHTENSRIAECCVLKLYYYIMMYLNWDADCDHCIIEKIDVKTPDV